MKAWEIEHQTMAKAQPVFPSHADENWAKYDEAGHAWDKKLSASWFSLVPGSLAPCQLVVAAVQAMENKGYNVEEAEKLLPLGFKHFESGDIMALNALTAKIYAALNCAPKNLKNPYWGFTHYDSWLQVKSAADFGAQRLTNLPNNYEERVRNAWLGQIVGSSVGTQMEGYTTDNIISTYGEINSYLRAPETYNDDLTYTLAFLHAFKKSGYNISSEEIALTWAALIPDGYSAEEIALMNIRAGIMPPLSGRHGNWFSDWIGAQMRTAISGLVAPNNPMLAAELAFRDSVVSHSNNGALGGVFNGVLTSLAFVEDDVFSLLKKAINLIPAKSEYYAVVKGAFDECSQHDDWLSCWRILEEKYKKYHWIHAYPNAAAEVVALYYGQGDFNRTLNIICQAGRDTDCNAGQILTVLGAMGARIDEHWLLPLNNTVETYMRAYREFTIDQLVDWTLKSTHQALSG
ncbi:MAG: ADP-ribosylglycohydrolase family protein [Candidatus Adiutrix sp.]